MKQFGYVSFILVLAVNTTLFSYQPDLPEPYRSVSVLPYDNHGFFSRNAEYLKNAIIERNVKSIIELGSWIGKSTVFMGELIGDGGIVYAVDHWNGIPRHETIPEAKKRLGRLYQQFLSNIIHKNLAHVVVPVRMNTQEGAKALDVKVDLIYVDASHEEEDVYLDIVNWYPKLKHGGFMCGDDWTWETVQRGVQRAAEKLGRSYIGENNFWYFLDE